MASILGRWVGPGRKGGGWKKRSRKSRGVNDFRLVKAKESKERVERDLSALPVRCNRCRSAAWHSYAPFVSRIANVDDGGDTGSPLHHHNRLQ